MSVEACMCANKGRGRTPYVGTRGRIQALQGICPDPPQKKLVPSPGRECQTAHWPTHKADCLKLASDALCRLVDQLAPPHGDHHEVMNKLFLAMDERIRHPETPRGLLEQSPTDQVVPWMVGGRSRKASSRLPARERLLQWAHTP